MKAELHFKSGRVETMDVDRVQQQLDYVALPKFTIGIHDNSPPLHIERQRFWFRFEREDGVLVYDEV